MDVGPAGDYWVSLDTDGDGVIDSQDNCPLSNQTGTGQVDQHGCPKQNLDGKRQRTSQISNFNTCVELLSPTVQEIAAGQVGEDDLFSAVFWARAECQATELGATNGSITERYEVYEARWLLRKNYAQTRDRLAFAKEQACLRTAYPQVFPHADLLRDQALCDCTLDADGDGVSDCDDECDSTPSRTAVDAKGCSL
jgi:hypothetical protein